MAIATIAYFPQWYQGKLKNAKDVDKVRGDLALEFIAKCQDKGFQVVVVHGGSSKDFDQEISKIKGIKIARKLSPKRAIRRRLAYKTASLLPGVKVIITSEPEKTDLVKSFSKIAKPILDKQADIVVPERTNQSFKKSYPLFQYKSEVKGNSQYNQLLRGHNLLGQKDKDLDFFFGPRAFANKPKVLSLFTRRFNFKKKDKSTILNTFDPEDYSNILYYPIIMALVKKTGVKSVKVSFRYPKIQKENEAIAAKSNFVKKRQAQRSALLYELKQLLSFLKKTHQISL